MLTGQWTNTTIDDHDVVLASVPLCCSNLTALVCHQMPLHCAQYLKKKVFVDAALLWTLQSLIIAENRLAYICRSTHEWPKLQRKSSPVS